MKREIAQYNQSRRQGSIQMLLVVPRQIHHAAISLTSTLQPLYYFCYNPACTVPVVFVNITSVTLKEEQGSFVVVSSHDLDINIVKVISNYFFSALPRKYPINVLMLNHYHFLWLKLLCIM